MKKYHILPAALLACTLLAACGAEKQQKNAWMGIGPGADLTALTERTEYWDLAVESESLFDLGLIEKNPEQYTDGLLLPGETVYAPLGTQFLTGEPAQIWSEITSRGADIYLYRTDGGGELLLHNISSDYATLSSRFQCYADRDKNCYFYRTDYPQIDGAYRYVGTIVKMSPSGEILYETTLEPGFMINDICQMEDGRLCLLLLNYDNYGYVLAQLDPDTGQLLPENEVNLSFGKAYLGTGDDTPAVVGTRVDDNSGYCILTADMAAHSTSPFLFFNGTSYGWHDRLLLADFRIGDDGSMDFLWTDQNGQNCFREKMRMEKVEKTPLVLRGVFGVEDTWLSERVAQFNQKSEDYHIVVENCGYGNDVEDFARLTSIQVAAGKGPDILCGSFLQDYIGGMMDKGALEALNPYMEASGIREEDYFPLTFSSWRQGDKIYGVTPKMEVSYEEMDGDILGSLETPDIEALADALLAWDGNGVYRKRLTSGEVLNLLLRGSESLWGMVRWEKEGDGSSDSCNFNTPLFAKLLEVAKRYGYEIRREMEPQLTYSVKLNYFFSYNCSAEQESEGLTSIGTLFDDGCHAVSLPLYTLAVNTNSAHKEGAWEFITFLLGDEFQDREEMYLPPVRRESFDRWLEWTIYELSEERFENGHMFHPVYYGENTSAEKRQEYKKAIEDARPLPIQTAPILTIIQEEAADYFSGSKTAEEVSKVINNRVQLYLDERK